MSYAWADAVEPCAGVEVARAGEGCAGELFGEEIVGVGMRVISPGWEERGWWAFRVYIGCDGWGETGRAEGVGV